MGKLRERVQGKKANLTPDFLNGIFNLTIVELYLGLHLNLLCISRNVLRLLDLNTRIRYL